MKTRLCGLCAGNDFGRDHIPGDACDEDVSDAFVKDQFHRYAGVGAGEHGGKWLRAQWGTTDTGRKAPFYTMTAAGRRQLEEEERRWLLLTTAVEKALRFA